MATITAEAAAPSNNAGRSLRRRSTKVDYSEKIRPEDRFEYVKKPKGNRKGKKRGKEAKVKSKKKLKTTKEQENVGDEEKENAPASNHERKGSWLDNVKLVENFKPNPEVKKSKAQRKRKANKQPDELRSSEQAQQAGSSGGNLQGEQMEKMEESLKKPEAEPQPENLARTLFSVSPSGAKDAELEKAEKIAYDNLFEQHQKLREENEDLILKLKEKAKEDLAVAYVSQLEGKMKEFETLMENRNQQVRELKEKIAEMNTDASKRRAEMVKREAEMKKVIDAYKLITSTRVKHGEGNILKCRSVNSEKGRVMDYTLNVGDEEVDFTPVTSNFEVPEMFEDEITFGVAQTPKFMQLLLKSLH